MDISTLNYIGYILKNFGLIVFLASSVFVIYLAFRDTTKRGLYCFIPPYHLFYSMERLRHPWKKHINRALFGSFFILIIGITLSDPRINSTSFLSTGLNGLVQGSYYALMAFAIILIFKTTDLVNFAQADMAAVGIFFLLWILGEFSATAGYPAATLIPYGIAILALILFSAGLGSIVEIIFIKPVQKQHPITQIILTLGLSMMLSNLGGIIWDLDDHTLKNILTTTGLDGNPVPNIDFGGGISVAMDGLLSIGVSIVILVVIFSIFKYTLVGIALRATAQSQTTSKLMGINTNKVFIFSWAVSVVLGTLAALFAFAGKQVSIYAVGSLLLKGFASAVLGGFSSFAGAVVGGFLLGVIDNFLGLLTDIKNEASFLIILLVLIIRPEGLLGKASTKKV